MRYVLPVVGMLALCCGAASAQEDGCTLVADGVPRSAVVVAEKAGPSEKFAAAELRDHIEAISGAKLETHGSPADVPAGVATLICIGVDALPTVDPVRADAAKLGEEAFIIRVAEGRPVAIVGGGQRGTLYGVYEFLEGLGCRWWTPSESTIPKTKTIVVRRMTLRQSPRLEYRDIMSREGHGPEGQLWMARNKLNGMIWKDAPEGLGGRYLFAGKMLAHTLMDLLKSNGIEITPEMMSLDARGRRAAPGNRRAQLCFTNQAAIAAMARAVVAEYRKNPAIHFVMVGQEDGHNYCRCPDCQAIAEREESQSGPVIHFANAVAAAAEKEVPGAAVATNAYVWSRKPSKTLRPRKNVYIVMCPYECSFGQPMATSQAEPNIAFRAELERWGELTEELYIWDYTVNFLHYLMPHPTLDSLAPNVRYYADHKVVGVMEQGAWNCLAPEFGALRQWVLARALWNPRANNHALIEQFLSGYYGPAAPALGRYIDLTHRYVREHPDWVQGIYRHTNSPHIAPSIIAEAEAALRDADEAAADSRDETTQRRVRHAHMPVWYVLLRTGPRSPMWRAVREKVGELSGVDVARSFTRVVQDYEMNEVYEGGPGKAFFEWVAEYGPQCADGRIPAPAELADADWRRVRLIQGCQMDRGATWYVRADGTSDGWAIRPGNGRQVLHYLSDTNDFVPGREYEVYARVRADGVADDATGQVWSLHVGRLALSATAELLRDGAWHTLHAGAVKPEGIGTAITSHLLYRDRDRVKSVTIDCVWLVEAAPAGSAGGAE